MLFFVEESSLLEPDFFAVPDFLVVDAFVLLLVVADVSVLFAHEVQNAIAATSASVEMRDFFIGLVGLNQD